MRLLLVTPVETQLVSITPHTTVQELFTQACTSLDLNRDDYEVTYKGKTLDVSLKLHYSGLPDNAELSITRSSGTSGPVNILLLVDFLRFVGSFERDDSVWTALVGTCPSEVLQEIQNPIVVCGNTEIKGVALKDTALSDIMSDSGKVTLRLVGKDVKLTAKDSSKTERRISKTKDTKCAEGGPDKQVKFVGKYKEDEIEITFLGKHYALLFPVPEEYHRSDDEQEDFFELTSEEVKQLYQDLKTKRDLLEHQPFITRAMREQINSERYLNLLQKYHVTFIRIQFPNRIVLQGVFEPTDTIETVMDFVKTYLKQKTMSFYLYTSPPKQKLLPSQKLIDTQCFCTARMYFGCEEKCESNQFLREDLMDKMVTLQEANKAVNVLRQNEQVKHKEEVVNSSDSTPPSISVPCSSTQDNLEPSSTSEPPTTFRKTPSSEVPKWFKRL